ncbi:hypothetical protein SNE40_007928 [Patella caerulea]|uniref:BTB domain-containing protein n=1 Tax=Patella caerulea TaxID=87958 RepID=A0AAN8PUE5_PATCE
MEVSRCIDLKDKIGACMVRELYNMRSRGDESCDFELSSLDNTSYKVHSLLLSAVWNSFRSWRSGHHQDNKLTFAGVSGTELRLVVMFLYGWCSKNESENKSLQKALSQLGIDVLQEVHNEFMTHTKWTSPTCNKKSQLNPHHKQNEKNANPVDIVVKKEMFDYEIFNDNIHVRHLSNLHLVDPDSSKTNVEEEFLKDKISDIGNLHSIHQSNDTTVNGSAIQILRNQTDGSCKVSSKISPEHFVNHKTSKELQYQPSPKKKKYCDTNANECKEIKANLKTPRPIKPKICILTSSTASSISNLNIPISSKNNKCAPSILRKSFGISANQNMTKLDTCTTIVSTNITRPTVTVITALPNTNNIISTQSVSTPSYGKPSNDNITYTQNQQKLSFPSTPLCITKGNLISTGASGGKLTSPVTLSTAPSPTSLFTEHMQTISQIPQIGTMQTISQVPQLCTMQNINVSQGQCNLDTIHPYNFNPNTTNSVLVGPSGISLNAPRVPFNTVPASTVIGLPVQPANSRLSITKGPINTNPIFLPNNVPSSTIKFSPVPVQLIPVNSPTITSTTITNTKSITVTSHMANNLKYLTPSSDIQSIPVNNSMNILSPATPFQKVGMPNVTTVTNISPVSVFSGNKIPVVTQTASIPQIVNIRSKSEKCAAININSCKIKQQSNVSLGIFNHPLIKNHSKSFDPQRSKVRMVLPKFSSKSPRNGSSYTEISQTKKHLALTPTKHTFVAAGIEESDFNRSTLVKPASIRSIRKHNPSSCETTSSVCLDVSKKSVDIGQSVRPQVPPEDVKPFKEQSLDNDVFIIEEKIGSICASVKTIPVDKLFNEVVTKHLDFSSEEYDHESTDTLLHVRPATFKNDIHSKVSITQKKLTPKHLLSSTDDEHNVCKEIQNNPYMPAHPQVLNEKFDEKIAEYEVSTGESEQPGDFKDISDFMSHLDDVVIVDSSPEIATKAIKSEPTENELRTPSFKSTGVVLAAASKPNEVTMSMVLPRDVEIVKRFMNDQSP